MTRRVDLVLFGPFFGVGVGGVPKKTREREQVCFGKTREREKKRFSLSRVFSDSVPEASIGCMYRLHLSVRFHLLIRLHLSVPGAALSN